MVPSALSNPNTKEARVRAKQLGPGEVQVQGSSDPLIVNRVVAFVREEKAPHPYGGFVIVNAEALARITDLDLSALEMRVFFRIVAEMPLGNIGLIDQGKAAQNLKVKRESINRALSSLVKQGMLTKMQQDGALWWKVSPEYAWKGKTGDLAKEVRIIDAKKHREAAQRRASLRTIEGGRPNEET